MGRILGGLAVGLIAAAPLLAHAQYTYRCNGSDGKKYYGSAIPMQCAGRPVEMLNSTGLVVKRIDPVKDEQERAAKAAAAARASGKVEQSIAERDEERRNRALLATYTSVKDIEDARTRALRENSQVTDRFEQRIKDLRARRERYTKELDTYKKAGKASATVEDNIKNVELEIAAQENLLAQKKGEVPAIHAKYDEDKKRYAVAVAAKDKEAQQKKK